VPRPVAYRPPMRRTVIDSLLAGASYREAAGSASIPWRTWCDWTKQHLSGGHSDPDVDALIAEARASYAKASTAITAQVRIAGAKDWRAAAFLLQHRQGDAKARHDEKRARWEAEIAEHRANGDHVERHEVTGSTAADEIRRRVARLTESAATGGGAVGPDGGGGDGALDGVAVLGATGSTPTSR